MNFKITLFSTIFFLAFSQQSYAKKFELEKIEEVARDSIPKSVNIIVVGPKQSGKSTLVNTLLHAAETIQENSDEDEENCVLDRINGNAVSQKDFRMITDENNFDSESMPYCLRSSYDPIVLSSGLSQLRTI